MVEESKKYLSLQIARIMMKVVGFWSPETEKERKFLNGVLTYTLFAIVFALYVVGQDSYYSSGNFYMLTYAACSAMPVVVVLLKISFFILHREEIMKVIKYTSDNFWYADYNEFGQNVMRANNTKGILLICSFTFFVKGTVICYMVTPIFENIGKNDSERSLPFRLWNLPVNTTSPYFEVLFTIETLSLIHLGFCFCAFDNFLGILNVHTAGQFKILQHQIRSIYQPVDLSVTEIDKLMCSKTESKRIYENFKNCIIQHHLLILYTKKLETVFSYPTLCQLLVSGVMLCVAGFQVFLARGSFIRRLIFIAHTTGCFFQLFVITLTAHEVMAESQSVRDAAYDSTWYLLPYKQHKDFRKGIMMVIVRTNSPCSITAGGFFPVSLETFMSVLSTAASYFALLRKLDDEQMD